MAAVTITATDSQVVATADAVPLADGSGYAIRISNLQPAGETIVVAVNGENAWQGVAESSDQG